MSHPQIGIPRLQATAPGIGFVHFWAVSVVLTRGKVPGSARQVPTGERQLQFFWCTLYIILGSVLRGRVVGKQLVSAHLYWLALLPGWRVLATSEKVPNFELAGLLQLDPTHSPVPCPLVQSFWMALMNMTEHVLGLWDPRHFRSSIQKKCQAHTTKTNLGLCV
jgi:hypothetical protein